MLIAFGKSVKAPKILRVFYLRVKMDEFFQQM